MVILLVVLLLALTYPFLYIAAHIVGSCIHQQHSNHGALGFPNRRAYTFALRLVMHTNAIAENRLP